MAVLKQGISMAVCGHSILYEDYTTFFCCMVIKALNILCWRTSCLLLDLEPLVAAMQQIS